MTKERWRLIEFDTESTARMTAGVFPATMRSIKENIVPNTLWIGTPRRHGITLGYHADAERYINIEYCKEHDIEMARIFVGHGSAIYDKGNLLTCIMCDRSKVKSQELTNLYEEILVPYANALSERFNMDASYRPLNDIMIGDKKVTGCSFIIDEDKIYCPTFFQVKHPDAEVASKAIRMPPEKYLDKAEAGMESAEAIATRIYSYEDAAGREISLEEARETIRGAVAKKFNVELIPAEFKEEEKKWIKEAEEKYVNNDEWLLASTVKRKLGETPPDVEKHEYGTKIPGGPALWIATLVKENKIQKIAITGSIHTAPVTLIEDLEKGLEGCPTKEETIRGITNEVLRKGMLGASTPEDFVKAITEAVKT